MIPARVRSPLASLLIATSAAAPVQAQPQGWPPIANAIDWTQGTALGNVATAVAMIGVTVVGFMMMNGRTNWRTGAVVVLGCFILLGAATVVVGFRAAS